MTATMTRARMPPATAAITASTPRSCTPATVSRMTAITGSENLTTQSNAPLRTMPRIAACIENPHDRYIPYRVTRSSAGTVEPTPVEATHALMPCQRVIPGTTRA